MAEPPGLQELADTIGLNLKETKNGFQTNIWRHRSWLLFDYKTGLCPLLFDNWLL